MSFPNIESARVWAFERITATEASAHMSLEDVLSAADTLAEWVMTGSEPGTRPEHLALLDRFDDVDRAVKAMGRKLRVQMAEGLASLHELLQSQGEDTMVVYADFLALAEQNESIAGSVRDLVVGLRAEIAAAQTAIDNGTDPDLQGIIDRIKNANAVVTTVLANTPAAGEPIPEPAPEAEPVVEDTAPVVDETAPVAEVPAEPVAEVVPVEEQAPAVTEGGVVAEQPETPAESQQQ